MRINLLPVHGSFFDLSLGTVAFSHGCSSNAPLALIGARPADRALVGMVPRDVEIDEAVAAIGGYAASADWAS